MGARAIGRRSGWLIAGLLLALVPAEPAPAELAPGGRLVVLQGRYLATGVAKLSFVADETNLTQALIKVPSAGDRQVSGADVMADLGENLKVQAALYREAQRARGGTLQPLYVIIDPAESWAFATNRADFSYTRDGRTVGPLTAPVLVLGGNPTYVGETSEPTAEAPARNRRMLDLLRPWYPSVAPNGATLDSVLGSYRLTGEDGTSGTVLEWADRLSCASYLGWLERLLAQELDGAKKDGKALWAACPQLPALQAVVAEDRAGYARRRIAETVAHELGHLIHFAAAGGAASLGPDSPHLKGNSHDLTTLSNQEFAFTEGWAQANALLVAGQAPAQPGPANRVDYDGTAKVVRSKLNEAFAMGLAGALTKRRLLGPKEAFSIPPLDTPRGEFTTAIRATAAAKGLPEADVQGALDVAGAAPETARLLRAEAYVAALQARKGQLRSRYDFLRSEHAVGATLTSLRRELGQEANLWAVAALAAKGPKGRPGTLARLVEELVHRRPELRLQVYGILARATEGILITPEQVAFLKAPAQSGRALEVDLDQDGYVPAAADVNANKAFPAAFPPDPDPLPGDPDPLGATAPARRPLKATPALPGQDQTPPGFLDLQRQ